MAQVDALQLESAVGEMGVVVDESREDELAPGIDDPGIRTDMRPDLLRGGDGEDFSCDKTAKEFRIFMMLIILNKAVPLSRSGSIL
jgi:hypothetical protein